MATKNFCAVYIVIACHESRDYSCQFLFALFSNRNKIDTSGDSPGVLGPLSVSRSTGKHDEFESVCQPRCGRQNVKLGVFANAANY